MRNIAKADAERDKSFHKLELPEFRARI